MPAPCGHCVKIVIVVPAFNEGETVDEIVRQAAPFGEVLVVDDGSTDATTERARAAGATVLDLPENRGYEGALDAGFQHAVDLGGEIIATLDADGQFDPMILGSILAPLIDGEADLVLGTRTKSARVGEWLFNLYARFIYGVPDILCGVKGYRVALYRRHGRFSSGRSVGTELALASLRRGARVATVPAPISARAHGESRFGAGIRANLILLRALGGAIGADLARLLGRRQP